MAKRGLYYHLYMAQFSHAISVHESAKAILEESEAEREAEQRREQPCGCGERLALAAA